MAYDKTTNLQTLTGSAAFLQCQNNFVALQDEAMAIAGIYTFAVSPIIPTPTTAMQASTKKYVDDNMVALTGDQTVAGVKTFSSSPIIPAPTTDLQASTKKYVDDSIAAVETSSGQTEITTVKSTTNTSYEDISGLTVTITTLGGNVLVMMSSNSIYSLNGGTTYFKAVLDSTSSSESFAQDIAAAQSAGGHYTWLFTSVAAGSHTIKIQWKTSGATPKLNTVNGSTALGSTRIIAIEL